METNLSSIDRREVDYLIGSDWEFFHYPAVGIAGGILVLWNMKLVTFDVMVATSQVVIGNLLIPILGTWRIATVYGSRCCKERGGLWSQLEKSLENDIPFIIGGDFNCIIDKEEKRGGKRFLFSKGPREMKGFMMNSDFYDVGCVGPRFTWCNNKEGASRIWERLDRCMFNSVAIQKIPFAVTRHLARLASDHCPIVVKLDEKVQFKSKTIRFEDTWRSYPAAKSIVYHSWRKNDFGDEYMILQRKLSRTLKSLFFWKKNKCKDLNVLKEKLKNEILELQNKEALGVNWSVDDLFMLRNKVHELNVTLKRLSTWWNQRAKARWHEEGDTNSKLFHNYASARRNGNRIIQIKDELNNVYDEDEQIEKVFINFFEKKGKHRNSIFQQGNNKSPGLDGVTSSFYKSYCSIVWETLWNAVNCFFKTCYMHREWKNTLIVLISKIKNPMTPNFRPISLCQTNYKIVATMLVNRLKKVISKMISEEQVAFIHGRSIAEHCLLAQEIFHKFRISKNKKGLMAIKLDMEQAYDSMGWESLRHTLDWYGFPTDFSKLLMECVVDVRLSIIINGRNSNWIDAQSGFRQRCPLSPYLFILCSQLLSNSLVQRGQKLGIQISPRGPLITHLLYADDVLMFSHASMDLAKYLKTIVEDFCKWTGQKVNVSKSQMIFGKVVRYSMKKRIAKVLGFKVVKEMKYLGVKMSLHRLKMADFQEILSNVMDKLNDWSKKSLSLGGKLILIDSSLLSMPNFLITQSIVPKRVLHELEKLCRSFIWHKNDGINGMHYVAWDDLCKPRCWGGLGLHSPLWKVGSLRSKLAWNFIQKPQSLFHRAMAARYGCDVMNGTQRKINSIAWQILVDGGKFLKMAIRWRVGKGDRINILNDTWLLDTCINRWPTFVDYNFLDGMYIQQILLNNGEWDYIKLQRAFNPDLVFLISPIHIEFEEEDQLELIKRCSGKTISTLVYEQVLSNNYTMEDVEYFNWLQKLKLKKKVEIFWWRLGKAAIPTNLFLKNRRISVDDLCPRGCQIAQNNFGIVQIYCNIVYHSWKNRNAVKHGKTTLSSSMVASNALFSAISNSGPYLTNWGSNLLRESKSTWCPPPKDWIKINIDASLLSSNLAGVGGVFRDHKGRFISAFGKNGIHWDIAQLELEAVFSVKEFLRSWMLEYKGLIIESDNANVIKFIQESLKKNKW
ncbi:hypothetical protein KFK09_009467 [Dendrobium nobile]|uniref:Reverse transcriptase domain-containing protein n=1 Tax=Dendrobium nobile TaxID=94219 RepID=A0A8T3BMW1_DENNO|nr:hypothetical protein KFK09_009467 [Dendrobium nobile]